MSTKSELANQLHVYHNPFSGATQQPKIPDGKAPTSLGYSHQSVFTLKNSDQTDTMDVLLFPGLGCSMVMGGSPIINGVDTFDANSRAYATEPPSGNVQGTIDWSGVVAGSANNNITQNDDIAQWRIVSTGLQMKLLNPVEKDEGWWEAIRITRGMTPTDYRLSTLRVDGTNKDTEGVVAPIDYLFGLAGTTLSNDPTYSTGLLRDLHRLQFELHPVKDYHDFITSKIEYRFSEPSMGTLNTTADEVDFETANPHTYQIIESNFDTGHDMVLLRLHCRANIADYSEGSEFHVNMVRNLELQYGINSTLNSFETATHNIGAASEVHANAKLKNHSSAHMVSP